MDTVESGGEREATCVCACMRAFVCACILLVVNCHCRSQTESSHPRLDNESNEIQMSYSPRHDDERRTPHAA